MNWLKIKRILITHFVIFAHNVKRSPLRSFLMLSFILAGLWFFSLRDGSKDAIKPVGIINSAGSLGANIEECLKSINNSYAYFRNLKNEKTEIYKFICFNSINEAKESFRSNEISYIINVEGNNSFPELSAIRAKDYYEDEDSLEIAAFAFYINKAKESRPVLSGIKKYEYSEDGILKEIPARENKKPKDNLSVIYFFLVIFYLVVFKSFLPIHKEESRQFDVLASHLSFKEIVVYKGLLNTITASVGSAIVFLPLLLTRPERIPMFFLFLCSWMLSYFFCIILVQLFTSIIFLFRLYWFISLPLLFLYLIFSTFVLVYPLAIGLQDVEEYKTILILLPPLSLVSQTIAFINDSIGCWHLACSVLITTILTLLLFPISTRVFGVAALTRDQAFLWERFKKTWKFLVSVRSNAGLKSASFLTYDLWSRNQPEI